MHHVFICDASNLEPLLLKRTMIKRILVATAITAGVALVIPTVLIALFAYEIWYDNSYKILLQRLEVPHENAEFVLLTDIAGFGDRSWYVYRL